jgi:PAS domain S-box-containing protein
VTWWLGDLAGAVTVGPLVIAWVKRLGVQLAGWRLFEAVLLLVLLSVAAVVTYGDSAPAALRYYPLTRLIIPFSIWAAFRLGYRGLTLSTVLVSLFAAWGTVRGNGPFVTVWGANESLIVLQLFISTNAVTFLFLASVLEERRLAKESQSSTDTVLRHLASIVENTDDVVIGRDLNGLVTSWNAAAERLYGYKAEEMIGQPVSILIPPDRPNEEPEILARLSQGERIDHYETVRKAKDGRLIEVSLTVSPIKDAVGKIIGYSKIARDITDRRRAEAEREALLKSEHEARAQAEEANRVKDEFLAVLSHELRTPLNAILGWANLLRSGKLDPQNVERALEIVERNAKAQSKLIEGVLDVSRIVSGKLQLDVRPLQLSGVVQAAVDSIRPAADAKNTMLRVITSKQVEPLVRGDANRLQQVVWNLLSNAVKFSPAGSEISVGLNMVNSDVEITVRDNGQGIAKEFLPHVFDRFRQADASTTRKHGGLGLGLAIVRHLVDLHGGTVTAESDGLGRGATFRVRLKAIDTAVTPVSITTEEPAETARASLLGLKVLVVDDHEDGREVLAEMLSMCDAQVRVASSASEAFEVVQSWQPQVIVSDISMPDVDGYGFIRQLRELDGTVAIPAIAVTAHALPEDRERALAAGFQNHVAKPIQLSELILTIAKLTDRDKI